MSGWRGTANLPLLEAFPWGSERLSIKPIYSFEIQVNWRLHFTQDVQQHFTEPGGRRLNDHGVLLAHHVGHHFGARSHVESVGSRSSESR